MQIVDVENMLPVGTVLRNTYIVDGYLASGGFGNTYLVHHKVFGEKRAVKEFFLRGIMTRGGDGVSVFVNHYSNMAQVRHCLTAFMDEAKRMHGLNNAHIVKVHDVFEGNGTAYYVMDYIHGKPLSRVVKDRGAPLCNQEVRSILDQMLHALDEIHGKGLWHLDIKPSNIMLDEEGKAILIDFGTSKQIDTDTGEQVTSAVSAYTPGYAPSEQQEAGSKRLGAWSDLYALGATIYNLLTGLTPPTVSDICNEGIIAFRFIQGNDKTLSQLAIWLMNPRINERPRSVAQVREFLRQKDAENVAVEEEELPGYPMATDGDATGVGHSSDATIHGLGTLGTRQDDTGTSMMNTVLIGVMAFLVTIVVVMGVVYFINSGSGKSRGGSKKKSTTGIAPSSSTEEASESTAEWVEDKKITISKGAKTLTYTYTGPMVNGLPNGVGQARYDGVKSTTEYDGPFVDGIREGKNGTLRFVGGEYKGDVYVGDFHNDLFEGKCKYTRSDGLVFKGTAHDNDLYNGTWCDEDGEKISVVTNGREKEI